MPLCELRSVEDVLAWLGERGARGLASDSRALAAGDAFIAWPGQASDGRRFVADARAAGAVALPGRGGRCRALRLGRQ